MFKKRKAVTSGYSTLCKKCHGKKQKDLQRTKEGLITQIYNAQKASSRKRRHRQPEYLKEELLDWLFSQTKFHELYNEWVKSDYEKDLKPSVDRKIDAIHYCFKNIQLMTWSENNEKGRVSKFKSIIGENDREIVEFKSLKEAQETLNITNISSALTGRHKTAGGYKWRYKI